MRVEQYREIQEQLSGVVKDLETAGIKGLKLDELSLAELGKYFGDIKALADKAKGVSTALAKEYDFLRFTAVPDKMQEAGLEQAKIENVGRLQLDDDIRASIVGDSKEDAFQWLDDTGHGDLVQPGVHAGSLKALLRTMMKEGEEIPEELFNISAFTRAKLVRT